MPNNAVHQYTQQQHDMHAHIQVHHNTQSSHAHIQIYINVYNRTRINTCILTYIRVHMATIIHALIHIHMQHSAII